MSTMPQQNAGGMFGTTGSLMGNLQNLGNNPLFNAGVGLLAGAAPGGTFAGGMQQGLLNYQAAQNQNQMRALRDLQQQQTKMRVDEMQRKQDYQEKLRAQGSPD